MRVCVFQCFVAFFPKPFIVRGSQCFLKMCPPFVSLLVSALFRWPCSYNVAFLFICLPGLSLLVSALFRWPCSISIHLSPRSVTAGVRPFLLAMQHSIHLSPRSVTGGVRPFRLVRHWWCPPFSGGHVAFEFIRLPGLSLVVSALFCWPCSISTHLSPRSVTAGVRPFPLAMQHFYSFVFQVCHWRCPPFSAGHVAFEFICLPGLLLLVSALFRWPCSISIHLSQVCHCLRPPFSAGDATFLFIPQSVYF